MRWLSPHPGDSGHNITTATAILLAAVMWQQLFVAGALAAHSRSPPRAMAMALLAWFVVRVSTSGRWSSVFSHLALGRELGPRFHSRGLFA